MILNWRSNLKGEWSLLGYDTFEGAYYSIAEGYRTKERAIKAAKKYLKKLERTQPSEISGGQDGIQDQVYVRGPEGMFRVFPDG